MSDGYFAEPARIQAGLRQMFSISTSIGAMVDDFVVDVRATRDWPGQDDSFAKEVIPQEQKERESSSETAIALSEAVNGVAHGTSVNLKSIKSNQNNILDSIRDHRIKPNNSGKR
ncbi:hypothetical protein OHU11_35980 [Streptomyces sp. NBC_00257]|uniref:Uncharacterized protein n=1 Tax=Streptomyces sanglieri TaxID=193460 RepID=A0ABW2X6Z3_9ACTN|nr:MULTISPECIES: hypothetical protein [Streptomyces]WSG49558.1 hypothetical protein OHA38_06995 [Streptomyces sp. NBC_01732]WSW09095.1 hypothetical protein OG298_34590 [Streptomyces sp. NBC_01005]WSX00211.1 hypothetical protein OG355_07110 [Streptomyces sp. NBC_00987]WTB53056.1 hypothetical protein OG832_07705 [Streptomyces sp. NBC_00826]WTC98601.1 hypothetical protein OH736_34595 [Streptomyces sp. NBC_01650]WTH94052.1 hypothetical protein OIC43_35985 [Streptomyces sp. NBC_00825]WTI02787.1 h